MKPYSEIQAISDHLDRAVAWLEKALPELEEDDVRLRVARAELNEVMRILEA